MAGGLFPSRLTEGAPCLPFVAIRGIPRSHPSGDFVNSTHFFTCTLKLKELTVTIEIRDASLEARIRK
jgi:hypothetical protein